MDKKQYLWEGLDSKRYEIIDILPQKKQSAVIIMRCRDPSDRHWCLEYLGNGHYFSSYTALAGYYQKHFKKKLNNIQF